VKDQQSNSGEHTACPPVCGRLPRWFERLAVTSLPLQPRPAEMVVYYNGDELPGTLPPGSSSYSRLDSMG